jgi:hypothetical protein
VGNVTVGELVLCPEVVELELVRVVALVEFAVCSGEAKFGDTCKAFGESRAVVWVVVRLPTNDRAPTAMRMIESR